MGMIFQIAKVGATKQLLRMPQERRS